MKKCINIGCGNKIFPSDYEHQWINIDICERQGVDIVRDLKRGLPFDDISIDLCFLDNVLEHFYSDDAIFLINEMSRVLKQNSKATIIVPHADSQAAKQDPTHRSFWVPNSQLY